MREVSNKFNATVVELDNGKEFAVPTLPNFEALAFQGEEVPSLEEQADMINEAIEIWKEIESGGGEGLTPLADLDKDDVKKARAVPSSAGIITPVPSVGITDRLPPFTAADSNGQAMSGNRFGLPAPRGVAANEVCMIPYTGRYSRPPVEDYSGAYYYKMSQNNPNSMRSLRIIFNPRHIQMRNNIITGTTPITHPGNNAWVFLSAFGQGSNPPEFGVMSGVGHHGRWHWFTRNAGQAGVNVQDNFVAGALTVPDQTTHGNGNHFYTYTSAADPSRRYTDRTQLTIRVSIDGNDMIGEIWNANTGQRIIPRPGQPIVRIPGAATQWNQFRTFLVGVSFVPIGTTSPVQQNWINWRPRQTFLRNVDIQGQFAFSGANWTGTQENFIPTPGLPNMMARYGVIPRFRGCARERFGMESERVSIDNR